MKVYTIYKCIFTNILTLLPALIFGWSTVTTISDTGINYDPFVKINSSNEAIAVWTKGSYPDLSVQAALYDGSSWSSATDISGTEGTFLSPKAAIDGSGNIVVVWESIDGGNRSVMAITKPAASGWGSPTTLSASNTNQFTGVAMNASGEAIAAWVDTTNDKIQVATLTFGGSWSSATDATSGGGYKGNLQVGIDSSGNGFLLWEELTNEDIAVTWTTGGFESSWASPATLASTGTNTSPSLSVDNGGTAIATWTELDNGDIRVSLYSSNSWTSAATISDAYSAYSQAVASGSNNFDSWLNYDIGTVQSARYVSSSWGSPVNVSDTETVNDLPVCSVSSGTSVTAWTDLLTGEIKAAEYATTGSPTSPTVISNQDLSVTPMLTSSSTATIAIWKAYVDMDHVIQVNIN